MEAIVLAGGFGTRLRPVVADVPKPMAAVAGRPFLEILLTMLAAKGFTRIILSLGFMAEIIEAHFGDNYQGMKLAYEIESEPLGTGGAIRLSLTRCKADHVFVFNGDTYLDVEVDQVEQLWQAKQQPIIVVREVQDTARFGRINMKNGHINAFSEKGQTGRGFINAGCYVLPKNALDSFPLISNFSLENDFFIPSLANIPFNGFVTQGCFIDIGVPEDYKFAQTLLADL
jgi:D-glycero-alpha-D-manno-heptose 1-phosphate guanylyltransferase